MAAGSYTGPQPTEDHGDSLKMKALNLALAAALLTAGGAASAQSPTDVQCIVVANAFAGPPAGPLSAV